MLSETARPPIVISDRGPDLVVDVAADIQEPSASVVHHDGTVVTLERGVVTIVGSSRSALLHLEGRPVQRLAAGNAVSDLSGVMRAGAQRRGQEASGVPFAVRLQEQISFDATSGIRHRNDLRPDPPAPGEPAEVVVHSDALLVGGRVVTTHETGGATVELKNHPDGTWRALLPGVPPSTRVQYRISVDRPDGSSVEVTDAGPLHLFPTGSQLVERQPDPHFDYLVGPFEPPVWTEGVVGYHLLVDRFAGPDGNVVSVTDVGLLGYAGGTIDGALARLDHLSDLGVGFVLLSPVHEGDTHVCYDVVDLTSVATPFGSVSDFERFCAAAHERDIKIVLDVELSYLGSRHPQAMAGADRAAPESAWFRWSDEPSRFGWWGANPTFVALDHRTSEVRAHCIDALLTWIDRGVDGFRFDSAHDAPLSFWTEVGIAVRSRLPDSFCFVEDTRANGAPLRHHGRTTGFLDFETAGVLRELASAESGPSVAEVARRFVEHLDRWSRRPPHLASVTFVDNHDGDRIGFVADGDEARIRMVLDLLLALPGVPLLYYGTEAGIRQDHPGDCDLVARGPMPWDAVDHDRLAFVKALIDRRRTTPALASRHVSAALVDDTTVVITRGAGDERSHVVANPTPEPVRVEIESAGTVDLDAYEVVVLDAPDPIYRAARERTEENSDG